MACTFTNPSALFDPTPFGYAHTAVVPAVTEVVLVSGQYGADAHGGVADVDFAAQVERAFTNLATALDAHGLGLADVAQLRTYVVGLDVERLGVIGAAMGERWGPQPPTQTLLGVAALALPEIQFEVEAVAVRTVGSTEAPRV